VTQLRHVGTFTIATTNRAVEIDKAFDARIRISG
jgi:hypothetical protein